MNFMNGFIELSIIKNVFGDFETLKNRVPKHSHSEMIL